MAARPALAHTRCADDTVLHTHYSCPVQGCSPSAVLPPAASPLVVAARHVEPDTIADADGLHRSASPINHQSVGLASARPISTARSTEPSVRSSGSVIAASS